MKLLFGENFHDAYDAIMGLKEKGEEMIATHDHSECLHEELKYCSKCELAYCTKCLKEWGTCRQLHYYIYSPPIYLYPTTTWPNYTTTWITSTSSTFVNLAADQCNHIS